ncbi:MAG: hypothetical protein JST90_17610 [Bacteroidetes bacterium]|nr:hypothetical protein [Bacteroidota bacterium]
MKRIPLSLLILFTLSVIYGFAQDDLQDVIYVHNGSIYKGKIVSPPDAAIYKIEIYGGSTISIPAAEADSVHREPAIVVRDRYTSRWLEGRSGKYARIEACGSLLMYTQMPAYPGSAGQYVFGGGFSFLPEVCQPHRNFSFLGGLAVQIMNASNYSYEGLSRSNYGTIDHGTQVRLEFPVWFRWSWGHRLGMFFQFGVSTGFNCYMGSGSEQSSWYPPSPVVYGHLRVFSPFINLSPLGFGFRKELPSHISFITYLEGAPINFEIADNNNPWKPYLQLHAGINFDPKYFIKKRKEQRTSKLLQKDVL